MKISIVIIGYNTRETLSSLLDSINKLNYSGWCEVVYVDDGSRDGSEILFKEFNLKFVKKMFHFKENRGRVYARQKAISMCVGHWICFVQSNVVVDRNLLLEYTKTIKNKNVVAVGGCVVYESSDVVFEQYLNHKNRGVNQYKNYSLLQYKYLLFLNCFIKRAIFSSINFNVKFKKYGGKELDFSYRLNQKYPNSTIACTNAVVKRIQYLDFPKHCLRMIEFGEHNFQYLNHTLKNSVIQMPCLLHKSFVLKIVFDFFYVVCLKIYSLKLYKLNYFVIRLGLLSSVLKGYYRSK